MEDGGPWTMTMKLLICPSRALWTAAAAAIIKSTSSSSCCCCCRLAPYYSSSSRLRSSSRKSSSIEISKVASPLLLLSTSFISASARTSSSGRRTRHCSSDGITIISATSYRARASSTTNTQRQMSSISSSSTSKSDNDNTILQPSQVQNRVALLQLPVTHNKDINLQTAITYIRQARTAGARLCVLPEIWNSPYATSAFPEYAELLPQVGDCLLPSKSAYGTTIEEGNNESGYDDDNGISWGKSSRMLMEMAKLTNMYIVGGSIPEVVVVDVHESSLSNNSDNHEQRYKYFNTCLVINPHGKVVAKHRKVHLFDVNVPGGIQFKESETLTPGDLGATYFDVMEKDEEEVGGNGETHEENIVEEHDKDDARRGSNCELGRIGIGICYDIRFPEYALLLTQKHQCKILIYPGAFNLTTGPAHWELLQRARAVDGQCYVLTASPARMPIPPPSSTAPDDDDADNDDDAVPTIKYPHYSAWGHSSVISPWGEVIATCDENPVIVMADLDMNKVTEMRMAIPTMVQKRHDLYRLVEGRNAPGDDNA